MILQNILFVLEYEGESKLAIYHSKLMQTDWKPTEQYNLELVGLSTDKVWENIVIGVGGLLIKQGNSLDEQIVQEVQDEQRVKLEKEIAKFEKEIAKLEEEIAKLEKQARFEK